MRLWVRWGIKGGGGGGGEKEEEEEDEQEEEKKKKKKKHVRELDLLGTNGSVEEY